MWGPGGTGGEGGAGGGRSPRLVITYAAYKALIDRKIDYMPEELVRQFHSVLHIMYSSHFARFSEIGYFDTVEISDEKRSERMKSILLNPMKKLQIVK